MTVTLEERAPTPYHLSDAVLLYETNSDNRNRQTVAVRHPVHYADGVPRLGEGTPVTAAVLGGLRDLLDEALLTYVPPQVVALGRDAVAWYEPAAPRIMHFRTHGDSAAQAFDGVSVPQPPLVFVARGRRLRVFAMRDDERPNLSTPLAAAPYWNVFASGEVCLGTMRVPPACDISDTESWSASFFASNFTHMNTGKRWRFGGTYAEMLTQALATGRFNPDWLQEPSTTLKEAVCG
jgi:PRTRC genetic system protein B